MTANAIRALVVDDNECHRDLLGAILATQGLAVDFAVDGRQAVTMAKAVAFDLILMDLVMPLMDGLEATALIRQDERRAARTPVRLFMVTTTGEHAIRRQALQAGADGYIGKPVDFRRLAEVAQEQVEEKRARTFQPQLAVVA